MAFEFPLPMYSHSPFSHSGLSMGMNDPQALMYDQIPPHIYDIIPQHNMGTPGPGNGSPTNLPSGERTETKPRLHKDEVARLEKIFLENHKPNSNTKRGLAEQMGVEVARINNWFQNRRAKAKQEKKQDEFEQRRKLAESSSQEDQSFIQQDSFPDNFDLEGRSHSSFSSSSNGPRTASICQPQYEDPTAASLDSFDRTMEAARAAAVGSYMNEHHDLSPTPTMSLSENCVDDSVRGDRVRFPSSDGWSGNFTDPFSMQQQQQQQQQQIQFQAEVEPPMSQDPLMSFESFGECSDLHVPLVDNNSHNSLLPSQLLNPNLNLSNSQAHEDFVRHFEQPEPESNDEQCPPQPDGMLRFRSPPSSINIAARRRGVRPAALGTTPRNNSFMGPRTATHSPTINRNTVKPLSPMRRIVSVSNLHSSYGNMNASRIQKSYPTSAQRSPINIKGFAEAESLFQNKILPSKRPSLPVSIANSVNPLTPMSPHDMLDLQKEMTTSSSSSSPEEMNPLYENSTLSSSYFQVPDYGEPKMASPPETPALYPDAQQHWASYNVSDEPLHTPGNMGFYNTDMNSPWNMSQPNTPGLPYQQASGFNYNYGNPQYGLQTSASSSNENLFPEGNAYGPGFIKSSPDSNKELQFENHTAKDYEHC